VALGLGIPWIFISLFTVQVLTLVFGIFFIVYKRRILSLGPIVFSIAVLALMNYTGERANEVASTGLLGTYSVKEYQLGYYLVYYSLAMFLFALILNEVTKKMQATKSVEENEGKD
jgi:energy-coupling factor transporter transmembrane protein EcfT